MRHTLCVMVLSAVQLSSLFLGGGAQSLRLPGLPGCILLHVLIVATVWSGHVSLRRFLITPGGGVFLQAQETIT